MNDYDPTSPNETLPARPASSATSGPPVAGSPGGAGAAPPPPPASLPDSSASATMAKQARRPSVRRLLSNRKSGGIAAAALTCAVIGLSVGYAASPSAAATSLSAPATSPAPTPGNPGFGTGAAGGGGSNARSGPAAGGASGTVDSVSTSSFTMSTAGNQKVTVNETSSTTYQKGTSPTSASAVTGGERILVLGTTSVLGATSGTTITATQVVVLPARVGHIPANYVEGSGTIVSGTTANKATEVALAAYPEGVVDRVVKLSNGEYEVHNVGVKWPHHIFVNQHFKVVGAF
jgi:hypothetical protein